MRPSQTAASEPRLVDFVQDRTQDGRAFRMLVVLDEFTRRCLAIIVARRLRSDDVLQCLADLFVTHGPPEHIAFVDATLDKCTNPDDEGQCAFLDAGDRLPGIPRHRFKAGIEYWLTSKWKFGGDLVAASNQPFFPNDVSREAEEIGDPLPSALAGYTRVDLHTSYDVTDNFQVYGLVLFDQRYGLYGTYFEADDVELDDSRTISPSMPGGREG